MNAKILKSINVQSILIGLFMVLLVGFAAVLFGLLAVTASPTLIALGVGVVGGAVLLAVPRAIVWIILSAGLVMGALSSFLGSAFDKLSWGIALLGMLLLIPVFLNAGRNNERASPPAFVRIAFVFLIYAIAATALNWASLGETLGGFKRYFQVYGLLFGLALLPFTGQDFKKWLYLLLAIALLQFPFALYELLVLAPQRGGLAAGSWATDVVAGTFGASLEGGSANSLMVLFLLIAFAFVFARMRNGLISTRSAVLLSMILIVPLGMGETKIAVFMLPMVWWVLIRHDFVRAPIKFLPILGFGLLATALLGYIYVDLIMESTFRDVVENALGYNFGEAGYASYYLNRSTVLSFWWQKQGLENPVSFFFGNGLGSSYLGSLSGHIALLYPYYGVNLTTASTILWDLGIFGLVLFVWIFISAWRTAGRIWRESHDPYIKADAIAIQAAISLFVLFIFYSQALVNLIGMEIIYSFVLGYLAFLYRVHRSRSSTAVA